MNLSLMASQPSSSPPPGKFPPGASHVTSSWKASRKASKSPSPNARRAPRTVPTLPSASAADGFSIPTRRFALVTTSPARSLTAIGPSLLAQPPGSPYPKPRYVQRVAVLIMKLTLAPGLVAATTLAARRWGALVGGVVGGFPAVVGPILVAIDAEHGDDFAARAAGGALAGLLSLTAFVLAYGWIARRFSWPLTLLLSWTAFALVTAALEGVTPPPEVALPLVLACFTAGYFALPRTAGRPPPDPAPRWDLTMRVVATA